MYKRTLPPCILALFMPKGLLWDKMNDHSAFMCAYDHAELATIASVNPQLWRVAGPTIGFAGIFGQLLYFLVIGRLLLFQGSPLSSNTSAHITSRSNVNRTESRRHSRAEHKLRANMRARTKKKAVSVARGVEHTGENIGGKWLQCCDWWTYKDYCIIVLVGHWFYLYWHSIYFFEDENSDFAIMVRRARPP